MRKVYLFVAPTEKEIMAYACDRQAGGLAMSEEGDVNSMAEL